MKKQATCKAMTGKIDGVKVTRAPEVGLGGLRVWGRGGGVAGWADSE